MSWRLTKRLRSTHQAFVEEYTRLKNERKRINDRLRVLKELGPVENARHVYCPGFSHTLQFKPLNGCERPLLRELLTKARVLEMKADGSRSGPIKAHKSFDEYSGTVTHNIPLPSFGWTLSMSDTPPQCKVKKVQRVVHHPASSAWTETVERYELENPEECLGKKS